MAESSWRGSVCELGRHPVAGLASSCPSMRTTGGTVLRSAQQLRWSSGAKVHRLRSRWLLCFAAIQHPSWRLEDSGKPR